MTILFYSETDAPEPWRQALAGELPEMGFRVWPDTGPLDGIRYALVWKPPYGLLRSLPRLKAILSLGAGVDHLFDDPDLPMQIPIVRMVDAGLAGQMSEYALYGVLHFHRDMQRYAQQQRGAQWLPLPGVPAPRRSVGVMGLGVLGADFVRKAAPLGFEMLGWARTARVLPGVATFAGQDALPKFLARTQILVNFLPLTERTSGLLNARTLALLPRGASIVNIARGAHIVEGDLLAALDSGHIGGAMLDVFEREPLPREHPLWRHPVVVVTPHIAAQAFAELMVSQVIDNIRRIERGERPAGLVDPTRGY